MNTYDQCGIDAILQEQVYLHILLWNQVLQGTTLSFNGSTALPHIRCPA